MSALPISLKYCIALFNFSTLEFFSSWHVLSAVSTVVITSVNLPFLWYVHGECVFATIIPHTSSKPALSTLLNNSRVGKISNSRITNLCNGICSLHAHTLQFVSITLPGISRWSYYLLGGKLSTASCKTQFFNTARWYGFNSFTTHSHCDLFSPIILHRANHWKLLFHAMFFEFLVAMFWVLTFTLKSYSWAGLLNQQ